MNSKGAFVDHVARPYAIAQLPGRHQHTGVFDQYDENIKRSAAESNGFIVSA